MLEEFPRDGLTDLACSDDERVLHVDRVPAGDPAGADPRQRDERHRRSPEDRHAHDVRGRQTERDRADDVEPREQCHEDEDPGEIVGGRVVGALFVAVVEAVELGQDDPDGEQRNEEREFRPASERGPRSRATAEDVRTRQTDDVSEEQQAADQPAATLEARRSPALDDVEGSVVEDSCDPVA